MDNYGKLIEIVKQSWRKFISRGYRTRYIPGLTPKLSEQFQKYTKLYNDDPFNENTVEKEDQLIEEILNTKRIHWHSLITFTDMKHSSSKAWELINKT